MEVKGKLSEPMTLEEVFACGAQLAVSWPYADFAVREEKKDGGDGAGYVLIGTTDVTTCQDIRQLERIAGTRRWMMPPRSIWQFEILTRKTTMQPLSAMNSEVEDYREYEAGDQEQAYTQAVAGLKHGEYCHLVDCWIEHVEAVKNT